ncbi:MAG: MFS transporter [Acidimicrobiia bacterium]|nr:MFS transporter [Acidimicrobiia bacterium]
MESGLQPRSMFRSVTGLRRALPGRRGTPGNTGSAPVMRAFRHRSFTVLWSGLFFYRAGFWIGLLTFQLMVARLTDNSPWMLGLLSFFSSIPMLVVTPFVGVVADRLDRKRLIVVNQASMGIAAAVISYLVITGRADSVAVMFGFAIVFGVGLAFAIPLNQTAVANSVPPEDLRSAVSINSIGLNLARIGGPALAGPILALWGPGGTFALWGAAALAGAVAISMITLRPYQPEQDTLGVFGRMRQGIEYVRERPTIMKALAMAAMVTVFGTSYMAVLPVVAYDTLGGGDQTFTVLIMLIGLGAMLGAFAAGSGRLRLNMSTITWGAVAFGVVEGLFGLTRTVWAAGVLVTVAGGLNFFLLTCLTTLVQTLATESKRGRVLSLFVLAWGGLFPFGTLMLGALGEAITTPYALAAFGLVLVVYSLWTRPGRRVVKASSRPAKS